MNYHFSTLTAGVYAWFSLNPLLHDEHYKWKVTDLWIKPQEETLEDHLQWALPNKP